MPGATDFVRFFRVTGAPVDGNLIGGDFCVTDVDNNSVCTVTDTGKIYIIDSTDGELGKAGLSYGAGHVNFRYTSGAGDSTAIAGGRTSTDWTLNG